MCIRDRREAIRLDPERPVEHIRTLAEARAESIAPQRLNATLFASFAALGMAIAALGIGSVIGLSVSQRTREFGIRAALGADRGRILGLVVREGLGLTSLGLAAGVVGAALVARFLDGLLYGVRPFDPGTWLGVALSLSLVAMIACLVPGRRAARVPPAEALKGE